MDFVVVAGEVSGDLHGASLLESLLSKKPDLKISAVAGPRMRALPISEIFPMEKLQVMGFLDVVSSLPRMIRHFFFIRNAILRLNPKAVICIDYPGFNLRLERSLRKKGFKGKLVHYICPTVWAWGKKRIDWMARDLDLLLTILPFEPDCFKHTRLHAQYVGHPLIAKIPKSRQQRENLLALFPGSRQKEIERNLPLQLAVAKKLQALDPDLKVIVSAIHPLASKGHNYSIEKNSYELMRKAKLALATSGTVALELALHNTPSVIHFAIRPLDQFLAQKIFRINLPFYALPNLIAKQEIFPELFGSNFSEESLFNCAKNILNTSFKGGEIIRKALGINDAPKAAAEEIFSLMDF